MSKIIHSLRSRTYIEILATLHLVVMAVIAWCLYVVASGHFPVDVSGHVYVDSSRIESELKSISSDLERIRAELGSMDSAIRSK